MYNNMYCLELIIILLNTDNNMYCLELIIILLNTV